ncbi:MAG: gliding motility lipoprotein GldH [Saprospiraceae bacterium]|nr:gliding motility lipoprotein GldH [Saprospiraceae bacterium]
MKETHHKNTLFTAFITLAFFACSEPSEFNQRLEVNPAAWAYADTLDFRFTITDTAARYNLYFDVMHVDTFPWQNLYTRLHTRFPDGKRLSKPVSFDLFNSRGESNGSCSGRRCTVQTVLQENTRFNLPGEYVFTVEQFMRRDSIPGIFAVEFTVQKRAQ